MKENLDKIIEFINNNKKYFYLNNNSFDNFLDKCKIELWLNNNYYGYMKNDSIFTSYRIIIELKKEKDLIQYKCKIGTINDGINFYFVVHNNIERFIDTLKKTLVDKNLIDCLYNLVLRTSNL